MYYSLPLSQKHCFCSSLLVRVLIGSLDLFSRLIVISLLSDLKGKNNLATVIASTLPLHTLRCFTLTTETPVGLMSRTDVIIFSRMFDETFKVNDNRI